MAVVVVPVVADGPTLSILVGTAAVAIAALGLDVLVGRAGQLSLAHAALLGVGGFTAVNVGGRGGPWPLAVVAAVVVTAAVSTVAGLPSLRIRGLQVAVVTLALQVMAERFLFVRPDVTAGSLTLERPALLEADVPLYLFSVACVALVLLVRRRLGSTRTGRALLAVRDVEARAGAFGVEAGPTKLFAYTLSGAIVGLGGAVLATKATAFGTAIDPFRLLQSLLLVAIVVVGGAGSGSGIILASLFIHTLPQVVDALKRSGPLVSAVLLVVSIVAQPEGIGGVLRDIPRRLRRGREQRPSPRPRLVELAAASEAAADLRRVPRKLALQMPVRALLEAREVGVRYGGVLALDDLSLEVRRGEIVGLIGANGAGKSTFFNAVSGFAPVTGSIRYKGAELLNRPPVRRSTYGLARTFQDMGLVRAETVRENVLLAQTWLARYPGAAGILGLGGTMSQERELRRRAGLALELFGLEHLASERLGDLPYGTMRTVEIAAAVASGPDLLLLDEASAGLGPDESQALGERFLALRDELGLTLVVIEHHVPLIARVCDYCYCLESGRLIAEGSPAEVTSQASVIASFLGRAASQEAVL
ncbi:MAG: ATP-binding cassette domain-containing protein [Actinobacteria bacterium]|nr:ATP-binding cassette domain-containing protein [Actinomycetota bacterium]